MKSDTAKAFNKRRFRYLLKLYAKYNFMKYAARRNFREKKVEKYLIKHKQIILVEEENAEIKI
jgi:hypothetical protein